jgi:hypothetical protein
MNEDLGSSDCGPDDPLVQFITSGPPLNFPDRDASMEFTLAEFRLRSCPLHGAELK